MFAATRARDLTTYTTYANCARTERTERSNGSLRNLRLFLPSFPSCVPFPESLLNLAAGGEGRAASNYHEHARTGETLNTVGWWRATVRAEAVYRVCSRRANNSFVVPATLSRRLQHGFCNRFQPILEIIVDPPPREISRGETPVIDAVLVSPRPGNQTESSHSDVSTRATTTALNRARLFTSFESSDFVRS